MTAPVVMRFASFIAVSDRTFARLGAAAKEHDVTTTRLASQICDAAGRLFVRDERTTAMPGNAAALGMTSADVGIAISDPSLKAIAGAAELHGLTIEEQLRAILDAAVNRYAPASEAPGPKPLPKRPAFDPAFYAKHAIIPEEALRAEAPVVVRRTEAVRGSAMQRLSRSPSRERPAPDWGPGQAIAAARSVPVKRGKPE